MRKAKSTYVFTCDRCKTEEENPNVNNWSWIIVGLGGRYIDMEKGTPGDLCQKCSESYLDWWVNVVPDNLT